MTSQDRQPESTSAAELGELSGELTAELLAFFRKRAASPDDAEDLLQETLLRVYQRSDEIRDADRLPAWVFRIARNLLVDEHRRRRVPTRPDVDGAEPGRDSDVDAETTVAGWLESFIDRLEPKYREVIRQSELQGVPHREIADDLGLSVSAIKSRVQRGRDQIRAKLAACCRFELDRRGAIVDYERRDPDGCSC